MTGPWVGGLAVRRMEPGQTAIADFLCTACGAHRRVAGRAKVADFVHANPIAEHRPNCKPTKAT